MCKISSWNIQYEGRQCSRFILLSLLRCKCTQTTDDGTVKRRKLAWYCTTPVNPTPVSVLVLGFSPNLMSLKASDHKSFISVSRTQPMSTAFLSHPIITNKVLKCGLSFREFQRRNFQTMNQPESIAQEKKKRQPISEVFVPSSNEFLYKWFIHIIVIILHWKKTQTWLVCQIYTYAHVLFRKFASFFTHGVHAVLFFRFFFTWLIYFHLWFYFLDLFSTWFSHASFIFM